MVVATDSSGATGSTNITFTIITYTVPTVTVMQPTNNSLFAPGSYTITANAVDQVGLNLTALALYMDGSMVATNTAGSTSNSISLTTNFNAGTHSIYAVAADLNGSTNSATNTVTVAVLTQPTVYFTNYNGYAINSSIYQDGMALIAVASSPLRAITNVQFFDNGTSLGNGTTAAFAITNWYAANWQNASSAAIPLLLSLKTPWESQIRTH